MNLDICVCMFAAGFCIAVSYSSHRYRLKYNAELLMLEKRVKLCESAYTFHKNAVDAYLKGNNEEMHRWLDWSDEVNRQIRQERSVKL